MVLFRAGQILTAGDLNALNDDDVFTPTLTASSVNPTMGTGSTVTGDVHYNGDFYLAFFNVTFGTASSGAGTGTYQLDLPAELTIDAEWAANVAVGQAEINDSGTAIPMEIRTSTATRLIFRHQGHATHGDSPWASSTVPMGNNDFVRGTWFAKLA